MAEENQELFFGTGVLISPNVVLTAAHVISRDQNSCVRSNIRFFCGATDSTDVPSCPVKESHVHPDYGFNEAGDIAILVLERKLLHAGSIGLQVWQEKQQSLSGACSPTPISITGYPGDKKKSTLWRGSGNVTNELDGVFQHDVDTYCGQSGSPLLLRDSPHTIGVHVRGRAASGYNEPIILNQEKALWITDTVTMSYEASPVVLRSGI